MPDINIRKAASSDMENVVEDVTVEAQQTDGVGDQPETEYMNPDWTQYWGYFNEIPDLKSAIVMKSIWVVGKGYTTDPATKVLLENINGWGKDTFDDILFNMEIIKRVNGDAYAEIIRNPDTGTLINLKPLNPEVMKIVVDRKGIILRYEQTDRQPGKNPRKFRPQDILHFSHNRLADQIHGISDIKALKPTIDADNEMFVDTKKLMHRQARPMILFKLDTDDPTVIDEFVAKMDAATNKGENIYIPQDKNSVDFEVVQINVQQAIFNWMDNMRNKFYRTIGLPQIIPGASGQSTESESKVIYFAFEQIVEKEQRWVEKQLWNQLAVKIDLVPPPTLQQELNKDETKDAGQALGFQPSDTTAGVGR